MTDFIDRFSDGDSPRLDGDEPVTMTETSGNPNGPEERFGYDAERTRGEVRGALLELLVVKLRPWLPKFSSWENPFFGTFRDIMTFEGLPAFQRKIFVQAFRNGLLSILLVSLLIGGLLITAIGLEAVTGGDMADSNRERVLLWFGVVTIAAGAATYWLTSKDIRQRASDLYVEILDRRLHIREVLDDFVSDHTNKAGVAVARVEGTVGRNESPFAIGQSIDAMTTNWRIVERMPYYIQIDWEDWLIFCRDRRRLPDHQRVRRAKQLALLGPALILGVIMVNLMLESVGAWSFGTGVRLPSDIPVSNFICLLTGAFGANLLIAVSTSVQLSGLYRKACERVTLEITEGLSCQYKRRAFDVMDMPMKRLVKHLRNGDGTTWGGWTKGYDGRRIKDLKDGGLSHRDAEMQLTSDAVIYVGGERNYRLAITPDDPVGALIGKIPKKLS